MKKLLLALFLASCDNQSLTIPSDACSFLAEGKIGATGVIITQSGISSVDHTGEGTYEITTNNKDASGKNMIFSGVISSNVQASISVSQIGDNQFTVLIYQADGTMSDITFSVSASICQ